MDGIMHAIAPLRGKTVGVLGLARSGIAVARVLARNGIGVVVYDDNPQAIEPLLAEGMRPGRIEDVARLDVLVVSPGVPLTHPRPHPVVAAAREAGILLTCDIDLFARPLRELGHTLVVVTGTNGKSTTTALIHHLALVAGKRVLIGGNIGLPVFELKPGSKPTIVVLELSSFQLDLCNDLRPDIAVWMNLTPDHLDRHGDLDGYIRAKSRVFARMGTSDEAIICIDDEPSRAVAQSLAGRVAVTTFGRSGEAVVSIVGGDLRRGSRPLMDLRDLPSLRGDHNIDNAAAATLALLRLGVDGTTIRNGLATFRSLPHRAEQVAVIDHVRFINDSKATNPSSAARSLRTFPNIYWIAGGKPKPGGFSELLSLMRPVRHLYLIGEAADEMVATFEGVVPCTRHAGLAEAMRAAHDAALADRTGEATVLLAPACASYDQFRSYEERGDRFREIAMSMASGERLQPLGGAA